MTHDQEGTLIALRNLGYDCSVARNTADGPIGVVIPRKLGVGKLRIVIDTDGTFKRGGSRYRPQSVRK